MTVTEAAVLVFISYVTGGLVGFIAGALHAGDVVRRKRGEP